MQNKVLIGLLAVLVIALAGLYFAITLSGAAKGSLSNLATKVDQEIQRLNVRTAPFVSLGEAIGYLIEFENGVKLYLGGDTSLIFEMKTSIGDYYKPDIAILPIGNYFTMGPKEAAYATSLINPRKYVIPSHFASFPMLTKDTTEFASELGKYNLSDKLLTFKTGVEQDVSGIKMVWLGHAAWFLKSPGGINILIDPAAKFSQVWPAEYKDFTKFGKVDLILLTHGHYDHVITSDLDKLGKMYDPIVFATTELGGWLNEVTVLDKIFNFFNKGSDIGKAEIAKTGLPVEKIGNIRIHATPASHSSSGIPQ